MTNRQDRSDTGTPRHGAPSRPTLPSRLRDGNVVVGCMVTTRSTEVTRTLATAGCDFLIFDAEHTAIGQETILDLVAASAGLDCYPIVRVPTADASLAKPALDVGAMGIAFPHVTSVADAEALVSCTKYPPMGHRGVGPAHAMRRWGMTLAEYLDFAREDTLAVAIVESVECDAVLDDVLQVPGLDVVLIAREDLAASMGHLGNAGHPDVVRMAEAMEDRIRAARIPLGCRVGPDADLEDLEASGYQFIIVGSDMQLLAAQVRARTGHPKSG